MSDQKSQTHGYLRIDARIYTVSSPTSHAIEDTETSGTWQTQVVHISVKPGTTLRTGSTVKPPNPATNGGHTRRRNTPTAYFSRAHKMGVTVPKKWASSPKCPKDDCDKKHC